MGFDEHRPRLVAVDPRLVTLEDGTRAVAVHDPMGIVEAGVVLSPGAWWLAAHFDGRHDLDAIVSAASEAGLEVTRDDVAELAAQLRTVGLVHGPAYEALRSKAVAAFRALRVRPPACAGGVYPARAAALRVELERWLESVRASAPDVRPEPVRLLVAPHIDYRRGGEGYAHAYRAIRGSDAELVVVFGTAHATPPRLFTLTRLDYDTPFGPVPTDRGVLEALVSALGEDEVLGEELCHRDEHSCELQLPWLRLVLGERPFTVLPVLCSSIAHLADPDAATAPFLDALRRAVAGRRVLWIAAADLAHVGPRYGDPAPQGREALRALAAEDLATLAFVARGDAAGFHRDATRDDARRRLCGAAPIYAALRASGAAARLLHHGQWSDGTDSVSYAAAAG
jgi:MEMO1 family protein